jgi:hypothetical protein
MTRERGSIVVRSGGQSGVDRAALEVAAAANLPYAGWCPAGGWAEDFPTPPGIRTLYPNLVETPSADPMQRTAWNVRDSDATLILMPHADLERSPATAFTRVCAELIFAKPYRVEILGAEMGHAIDWLAAIRRLRSGAELVLNVAGPRESEHGGIRARSVEYLARLLGQVRASFMT